MDDVSDGFGSVEPASAMPDGYPDLFGSVSRHVSAGRRRAVAAATQQLVLTYWQVGREILEHQDREGYGTKVIACCRPISSVRFPTRPASHLGPSSS